MTDSAWGYAVQGRSILAGVRQSLIQFQPQFIARQTRIAILRFQPPPDLDEMDLARFDAARVSMEQKAKSFQFLGCQIEPIPPLPFDLPAPEFRAIIGRLNANPQIRGIIVQYPVDRLLAPLVREIAPEKDLDALSANSPFRVPATSAGIVRIVEPFATDALIAVVGARGFVGQGVVQQLRGRGLSVLELDQRDQGFVPEDLLQVRSADIVVSATGQPELLDEQHLVPYHRLVVDSGFINLGDRLYGDIRASARAIAQNFTPVPGGVGPTEMAVLMERLISKELTPAIEPWKLEDSQPINFLMRSQVQRQQQQWASAIFPIAIALFDRTFQRQPDTFQTDEAGAIVLPGRNYTLRFDPTIDLFAVEGTRGRGRLAAFRRSQGTLITAEGLTGVDAVNWQQIRQRFLQRRQRDQDWER